MKVREVKITNKVMTRTKRGYVVEVEFMYGDADGYCTYELYPFMDSDMDKLIDCIETCDRMKNAYPYGRCGYDDYDHVEGFDRWFNEDVGSEPQGISMVYCPNGDGIQATLIDYTVYYYDNDGIKWNCDIYSH